MTEKLIECEEELKKAVKGHCVIPIGLIFSFSKVYHNDID